MLDLNRRSLITGLISLVAAPAIVRAINIMPVRSPKVEVLSLLNRYSFAEWTSGMCLSPGDIVQDGNRLLICTGTYTGKDHGSFFQVLHGN
jgi:hypothetical protein